MSAAYRSTSWKWFAAFTLLTVGLGAGAIFPRSSEAKQGAKAPGVKRAQTKSGPAIPVQASRSEAKSAPATRTQARRGTRSGPLVRRALKHDTSIPLREMKLGPVTPGEPREIPMRVLPKALNSVNAPQERDPAVQSGPTTGQTPAPLLSFQGGSDDENESTIGFRVAPPDTNGDVGPNHYVQYINLIVNFYDKAGTRVLGPVPGNFFWTGFGGDCESHNDGDPIVLYDQLADRWFASQFALFTATGHHQCIAVSTSGDPTGSYNRYDFLWPNNLLNDYPKFGIWPDAYYMTANEFIPGFEGFGAAAFDRTAMLAGGAATMIYFHRDPPFGGALPSDMDGLVPPAAGAPNIFMEVDDASIFGTDRLTLWEFHVDFAVPGSSTFTDIGFLDTAPFDWDMCGFSRSCIPQLGGENVDALSDRLMNRLVYRNFGTHEAWVVNHTVDADGTDHAGVRWYELRRSGGPISIFQQATWAPDASHRWMGSAAFDASGNIMVGYSVSSSAMYPSVRYAGRLVGDPLDTLQTEASLHEGTGAQTSGANRWGDYSMMTVDPVDDCTFWYTQEYQEVSGSFDWNTRIGSMSFFPACSSTAGILSGTVTDSGTTLPLEGAQVQAGAAGTFTAADGTYSMTLAAGTYDVTASKFGYIPQTVAGVVITVGVTTTQDFALAQAPMATVSGTVTDLGGHNWPLYARIDVGGAPIGPLFTSPTTGAYAVSLPEGGSFTLNVNAISAGYNPESRAIVVAVGGQTEDFALTVDPSCQAPGYGQQFVFLENFEASDGGFVASGTALWEHGVPTSGPGEAHSGVNVWATELSGNYDNNENATLTSPDINLSAFAGQDLILAWWQWANTEFFFDFINVDVSNDGGATWTTVYGPLSGSIDTSYAQKTVNLNSSYAVANFRVRFHFTSDSSVIFPGWYIDDVGIAAVPPPPPPVLLEDFASGIPATWTLVVNGEADVFWRDSVSNACVRGNLTGGTGTYAIFDSDCYGNPDLGVFEDSELISPSVDLSGLSTVFLEFDTDFRNLGDTADVDVSTDGGASWTNVWRFTTNHRGPAHETVDISALAGGQANVKVRFHDYNADWAWWWEVDNVEISGSAPAQLTCGPIAGGLLVGNTFDDNTGLGLNGSTVVSEFPAETTTSFSTPDDPALDEGFYILFSTDTGMNLFTASKSGYGSDTQTVTLVADAVVQQDFNLPAGFLSADPTAIEVTVPLASTDMLTLNLNNTGGADATFEIVEREGLPSAPAGASAPWLRAERQSSPGKAAPASTERADRLAKLFSRIQKEGRPIPKGIFSARTTEGLGLPPGPEVDPYAAGDVIQTWPTGLVFTWGIAFSGEDENVWVDSPSAGWGGDNNFHEYAQDGTQTGTQWPHTWGPSFGPADDAFNWNTGMLWLMDVGGDNCIHEMDPAGGVTGNTICPPWGISQRGLAYDPETDTWLGGGWNEGIIYRFDNSGAFLEQVNVGLGIAGLAFNPDTQHLFVMVNESDNKVYVLDAANNFVIIGQFNIPGFAAFQGAGLEIACDGTLWAVNQGTNTVYQVASEEDTNVCGADVPWLSEFPVSGTVLANDFVGITVTFDTTVLTQPGDYFAHLKVKENTPYPEVLVPVTMHVPLPPGWGFLNGTVNSVLRCDAPGGPLDGATVQVVGATDTFTLETDAAGFYQVAMDVATNSPVDVTVSAGGFVSQTATVDLVADGTVTQDVTLRLDAPCGDKSPASFDVVLDQGSSTSLPLTLSNAGAGALTFLIQETELPLPPARPAGRRDTPIMEAPPLGPTSVRLLKSERAGEVPVPEPSLWTFGSSVPGGIVRYAHAQCDNSPDSFYVISGVDGGFSTTANAWRYDAATNTWNALADMPFAHEGPAAACYLGKIYVMGGDGINHNHIYDIATDTWTDGTPVPRGVAGAAAAAWLGKVYLIGGDNNFFPGDGNSDEVNIYDIATDIWLANGTPMPEAVQFAGSFQTGQFVYVVGGWGNSAPGSNSSATQRYDIATDTWEMGPSFTSARADLALAATDTALYAIGGDENGGGFFTGTDTVERLDITGWPAGAWADTGDPLPLPMSANNAGFCTEAEAGSEAEVWSTGGIFTDAFVILGLNSFVETPGEQCFSIFTDIPWLSASPDAGSVNPDSLATVDVTFDASALTPGTYTATLVIDTNDSGAAQFRIPVNLTVEEALGTFTGVVRRRDNRRLVRGATVEALQGGVVMFSTVTNSRGRYTLNVTAGTYDLRARKGIRSQTKPGRTIGAGATGRVNFRIR